MNCKRLFSVLLAVICCGCASDFEDKKLDTQHPEERKNEGMGKFLGDGTLSFGRKQKNDEETGLGVNSYLWRASLDTIAFMPIASADPFGGVIITDWYSPPQSPNERLKVNVFILDRQLRSDGLKVTLFRQEQDGNGNWRDQTADPQTVKDLENAILARARNFRSKNIK